MLYCYHKSVMSSCARRHIVEPRKFIFQFFIVLKKKKNSLKYQSLGQLLPLIFFSIFDFLFFVFFRRVFLVLVVAN
jgi:hypothetical protein